MKLATIAYCSLGVLLYSVVMIQIGEAVQRGRAVTPVILTAAPCIEERTQLCLFDAARKREVRVLADGSVVYATAEPRVKNNAWSVP